MFIKKTNEPSLTPVIDRLLMEMSELQVESEEYAIAVDQLTKLYKIKNETDRSVSADTLAIVAGNLAGILLIVGHEKANVVTSKAINFVLKSK